MPNSFIVSLKVVIWDWIDDSDLKGKEREKITFCIRRVERTCEEETRPSLRRRRGPNVAFRSTTASPLLLQLFPRTYPPSTQMSTQPHPKSPLL